MTYAEKLYHHAPPAWLLSLPANDLAHGEGLSAAAEFALAMLPKLAAQWLQALRTSLATRQTLS